MAEGTEGGGKAAPGTVSVDMDAMIDEILAKKGPQTYKDGLSEQNWEEVREHHRTRCAGHGRKRFVLYMYTSARDSWSHPLSSFILNKN